MGSFLLNDQGQIILKSNFEPTMDYTLFQNFDHFEAIIHRDFAEKALDERSLRDAILGEKIADSYALFRIVCQHMYWANRYFLTLYRTFWGKWEDDYDNKSAYLPTFSPNPDPNLKRDILSAYQRLSLSNATEDNSILEILTNLLERKIFDGSALSSKIPTAAEHAELRGKLVMVARGRKFNGPSFSELDIINRTCSDPKKEAVYRKAMFLHNALQWYFRSPELVEINSVRDTDYVLLLRPSNDLASRFLKTASSSVPKKRLASFLKKSPQYPITPYKPVVVREAFKIFPKFEALSTYLGEIRVTNRDIIRNEAYSWSEMDEEDILKKTGISERRYTEMDLSEISLRVASEALINSGRKPEEIGAVIFCSSTTSKLMPSYACWISGQLGIYQTQTSFDLVAACAGFPYGVAQAIRILQEVQRPVMVICAEKFSNKMGYVRTSRMIFGDGAAAFIIGPTDIARHTDVEFFQTYGSGPMNEVDSIILPNPEFDNHVSVFGPDVRTMVRRYLVQMVSELRDLKDPDQGGRAVIDSIERIIPHHANKTMILKLLEGSGLDPKLFYFNIERVGNTSAASIPLALFDAVLEGVISVPTRVFAPGFGAGGVGGYVVIDFDPTVIKQIKPKNIRLAG